MKILEPIPHVTQPAVSVDDLTDPAAVGAGIELLDQDAVQLQSMPLQAYRVTVRLEDAAVVLHSTNRRVRTRTSVRRGLFAWVAFGPRTKGTVNGLPVRPGLVLAAEPGAQVGFVSEAGWQSVAYLVSAPELGAHLAARGRASELRLPRGVEMLQVEPESGRRLFAWGRRLAEVAAREPFRFDEPRRERDAARVELFDTLFSTIDVAGDLEDGRGDRTKRAQSLLVKRAEEFALSKSGEPFHVGDLCCAMGVSERTLEYAFKELLGLTPIAFLVRLRLHRVRRALLTARPGSTTVSSAALDGGFWHFGEFSRAYRKCFGELPSETLRRRPELSGESR